MKPPRTMQPERVTDWEKTGRESTKSFGQDSFHNYMARKIALQRQQFGLQLPPPPDDKDHSKIDSPSRSSLKSPKSLMKSRQKYSASKSYEMSGSNDNTQQTTSSLRVRFAPGSKIDAPADSSSSLLRSSLRRKSKRSSLNAGMNCMLRRLKRRHGSIGSCDSEAEALTGNSDSESSLQNRPYLEARRHRSSIVDEAGEETIAQTRSTSLSNTVNPAKSHYIQTPSPDRKPIDRHRPDLIFSEVVVLVNGDTNPDADTLQRLLHQTGGDVERYETTRVTHIVAEHLSFAKAKMYKNQRDPRPVVYPSWIVDSIAAKKLLPSAQYLLKEFVPEESRLQPSVKDFFKPSGKSTIHTHQITNVEPIRSPHLNAMPGQENHHEQNDDERLEETPPLEMEIDSFSENNEERLDTRGISKNDINHTPHDASVLGSHSQRVESTFLMKEALSVQEPRDIQRSPIADNEAHPRNQESDGTQHEELSVLEGKDDSPLPCTEKNLAPTDVKIVETEADSDAQENVEVVAPRVSLHRSSGGTDDKYINGRIRTVGTDPDFLKSFFRNSRLSYIGSFKQRQINRTENLSKLNGGDRFVFHIDMDCFFAAVVLRKFPQYRKHPVVISHHGQTSTAESESNESYKNSTSECATCNYEARKFGIKKGMYLKRAKELCPSLVVLSYDFEGYQEVSSTVGDIAHGVSSKFGGLVEEVSCDESYMELRLENSVLAAEIAEQIRTEIHKQTDCTATIGVAKNKFIAKLATDHVKPNRSFVVEDFQALLRPLKLRDLHGIGYRSEPKLAKNGLLTVQDVWDRGASGLHELKNILGPRLGERIWMFCRGEDDRAVVCAERKTIGAEVSFSCHHDALKYGVSYKKYSSVQLRCSFRRTLWG